MNIQLKYIYIIHVYPLWVSIISVSSFKRDNHASYTAIIILWILMCLFFFHCPPINSGRRITRDEIYI